MPKHTLIEEAGRTYIFSVELKISEREAAMYRTFTKATTKVEAVKIFRKAHPDLTISQAYEIISFLVVEEEPDAGELLHGVEGTV